MAEKRSPHSIEAIAVGTLVALELKTTKPKEEGKKAFTFLQAEIAAAGSKLRVTVWPSQKRPSLPQDLSEQLAIGQKVSARGSLEEQVGEDQRLYRGLRAWTVAPSDAHDEDKLVYHVAGHMGRLRRPAPANTSCRSPVSATIPTAITSRSTRRAPSGSARLSSSSPCSTSRCPSAA